MESSYELLAEIIRSDQVSQEEANRIIREDDLFREWYFNKYIRAADNPSLGKETSPGKKTRLKL